MASGELGTYSSYLRHHSRKHSGDFLRVGRSVCRYQTQWVGHHPSILGFSQMRLFLLLHRTALKGMSQTLSVLHSYGLEWGRPCHFWLPAKDIPGSNPQSMILQRWSINTSAPSSLGWDHSEACVLYLWPHISLWSLSHSLWEITYSRTYYWLPSLLWFTSPLPNGGWCFLCFTDRYLH